MHTHYHALIGAASAIAVPDPTPILSVSPIVLPCPERTVPLELRATVPTTGGALPIILLSHGHGRSNSLSSLEGYAPLAEFWAAHGFAVLQPTHLSSKFLSLEAPQGQELFYQERAADMVRILDNLDAIEAAVPGLAGRRLDRTRVAVAGHSLGGWTAAMLLGASNTDPRDGARWHQPEPRITAGVILAGTGSGGRADLSEHGRTALLPFYDPDFGTMRTPALVVYGDADVGPHLTVRGADWHADPYALAPGPKDLLVVAGPGGARHGLGGVSGWDTAEAADDESPVRLAVVQRMTWAYLASRLGLGGEDGAVEVWAAACASLAGLEGGQLGTVESKE